MSPAFLRKVSDALHAELSRYETPCAGWEGILPCPAITVDGLIEYLDSRIRLSGLLGETSEGKAILASTGNGIAIRNAYRLIDEIPLANMPPQPIGTLTGNDEVTFLKNLRRECIAQKAKTAAETTGQAAGGAHQKEPAWTRADGPTQWARLFGISPRTFKRRCEDGKIRHRKLSAKSYQVAVDDLPAIHQSKFRNATK